MRRILELGEQKPHEKEPPNKWVFRVLDLDPDDHSGLELRSENGTLYYGVQGTELENCARLNAEVETRLALESWMEFGTNPDDHTRAVSIIIHNEDESGFLLQRKDLKHPTPSCRGRYSLFGGSPHVGENILHAAYRELLEEIVSYQDLDLRNLKHLEDLTLDSVQWPGTYTCSVFSLPVPFKTFQQLVACTAFHELVSESVGVVITRDEFESILLPQEIEEPGRHFVASHHHAINRILFP
ncbi:MAG: NUDIX hydrolase [Candidatus Uhrbacteria bacterium]|nr:NUDIX hydrolase [Candidatus Uhrbacteria bacterium]